MLTGRLLCLAAFAPLALFATACADAAQPPVTPEPALSLRAPGPLTAATPDEIHTFDRGDRLFETSFRAADGLGPLYIRAACADCHADDGRGPGLVTKMVVVEADGFSTAADQSRLSWGHTERPYVTAGAVQPLVGPTQDASVRHTLRFPPAVFGRGYIEAVEDAEIERLAALAQTRTNGIRGRINRVVYQSESNPASPFFALTRGQTGVIGRFGLKARVATLDDFTADAFQGDMGITSPLRPQELPNPDALTEDLKAGVDVSAEIVNDVATYMRLVDIPQRRKGTDAERALFDQALCSVCHVPSLKTRTDYPIPALAGIAAPVFTDLLLHDMGPALADGVVDGEAGSRDWKTAPLMGLRYAKSFLHDGRARTVEDAILAHENPGSEGNASVAAFRALTPSEQKVLLDYVSGL